MKTLTCTQPQMRRGIERVREESYLNSQEAVDWPLSVRGAIEIELEIVHFVAEPNEPLRDELAYMKSRILQETNIRFPSTDRISYVFDFRYRCIHSKRQKRNGADIVAVTFLLTGNVYIENHARRKEE